MVPWAHASPYHKRHLDRFSRFGTARGCGLEAEWLACWTQAQKGPGSNRSHDAACRVTVLGKLFTPIVPLFTKQQNW